MKECSQCKEFKDYTEFTPRGNGYRSECKACHRLACREHYNNNKQYYFSRNKKRKAILRKIVMFYKDQPCVDCGVQYAPEVMQFDHLDNQNMMPKLANMNSLLNLGSVRLIEEEIAKCEVVCANCHTMRTASRRKVKSG